jgi:hypothetical protein
MAAHNMLLFQHNSHSPGNMWHARDTRAFSGSVYCEADVQHCRADDASMNLSGKPIAALLLCKGMQKDS